MARRQPNDFTKELLVHLSENVCRKDRKLVRAVGIIEISDDLYKRLVVDVRSNVREIGCLSSVLLFLEMKQSGVVLLIGPVELFT